jgi:trimeric autotransporter adhesin
LQAKLNQPASMASDAGGNIYFTNGNAVFRLSTSGTISRIAGNGVPGFSGDGGPAAMARLQISAPGQLYAVGLAVDGAGNVLLGDLGNRRVRRISPDGIIVTIAGNGVSGMAGDGGPAVEAQLGQPSGLAVDPDGNLYISDLDHNVVREVSAAGVIRTVAGTASQNPGYSGDGGPATNARLALPTALAADLKGNLFIADSLNHVIRKIAPDGTITTLPGSTALYWPSGLAVDARGNLFITDYELQAIRKVAPDGTVSSVAGNGVAGFSGDGGTASKAQVNMPWSLTLDGQNNLYFSDYGNQRIRRVAADGTITTVAGGGAIDPLAVDGNATLAINVQLSLAPIGLGLGSGLALDGNGNLFFAETGKGLIRKVSPSGVITTVAGGGSCSPRADCLGDGHAATNAYLYYPTAVALDAKGNLFIADYGNLRIRKVSADGVITTIAGNGTLGNSGDGGPAAASQVNPQSIAADGQGNLYVADGGPVRKITSDGIITTVAGGGACAGPSCDGQPAANVSVFANAVAIDNGGNLLIADNSEDDFGCYFYLRKVSPGGIISTLAGIPGPCQAPDRDAVPAIAATLGYVSGIATDPSGNILLSELSNQVIRRISPDGIITIVAGGNFGYSGDGGPAIGAAFFYPIALATDGSGNVFISDAYNQVIRVLRPAKFPLIAAVVDAASQAPRPATPGKVMVIYGGGLGPSSLAQNHPAALAGGGTGFSSQLAGTAVTFNSLQAPVLYVSATQVAVVVPYEIQGTTAQVQVTYLGSGSDIFTIPVAAAAPSLFTRNQSGAAQAAAINASDGKSNTALDPVRIGDSITLYATGEGQTDPEGVDGKLADSTSIHPVLPVSVTVGGIPALVQYAGTAPGEVEGVMQVNVQIPVGVQTGGYVPLVLQVGNISTAPQTVWIAVAGN